MTKMFDLYHTPYHLYDFSPKTIGDLLALSGFSEIETLIGGYTRPPQKLARLTSFAFAQLGQLIYDLSGGNVLFPGLSKTTVAFKAS